MARVDNRARKISVFLAPSTSKVLSVTPARATLSRKQSHKALSDLLEPIAQRKQDPLPVLNIGEPLRDAVTCQRSTAKKIKFQPFDPSPTTWDSECCRGSAHPPKNAWPTYNSSGLLSQRQSAPGWPVILITEGQTERKPCSLSLV